MLQLLFAFPFFLITALAALTSSPNHYLTATAVVSDISGNARIQCWQFASPFSAYPTVGIALHLGQVSNITYVVLPPRSGEGLHKPPHPMYVCSCCRPMQANLRIKALRPPLRPGTRDSAFWTRRSVDYGRRQQRDCCRGHRRHRALYGVSFRQGDDCATDPI